jgi:glycosyltransferase involved in cell wall biosynthesis
MPTVSIIIPVYNTEKYLRTCLDSIISQSYSDFEAILVDDGSTDNSGKICDEYATKDSRFFVVHKNNKGVAEARLTAFELSKGELVTFVDSDDIVAPDYLQILSKPILNNNADLVTCSFCYMEDDGKKGYPLFRFEGFYDGEKIKKFIANHYFYDSITKEWGMSWLLWSKMAKRYLVKEALKQGKGLWFGEDQLCSFYMLYNCKKLVILSDRLYYYMIHGVHASMQSNVQASKRYNEGLWDSLLKMFERYTQLDTQNIAHKGIRQRTWIYIMQTIFKKMAKVGISKEEFQRQFSKVRNNPFMKNYFKPFSVGLGMKDDIKYWILKLKLYSLFYILIERQKPSLSKNKNKKRIDENA